MLLIHKCTSEMTIQSFAIIISFISNVIRVVCGSLFIVVLSLSSMTSFYWCFIHFMFWDLPHLCLYCVSSWLCFICASVCKQACRDMNWWFSCAFQSFAPRLTWVVWTARHLWAALRESTRCPSSAVTASSITALWHSTSLILTCGPSLTCSMWRYVTSINSW